MRNPPAVIGQTIQSLIAQTDRNFSVLISDNYSTQGEDLMVEAARQLTASGLKVRRVKPPFELGRVEHWNWAHHESTADWLKPVFAGDWLETDYLARLRAIGDANPACRYVYTAYVLHRVDQAPEKVVSSWSGKFLSAKEMEPIVLRYGMQFGPPSAAAYEREAFGIVGGYPTTLPISADSLLFCAMAARFGAHGIVEPLCHFNIHGARFSTNLPGRHRDTFQEALTYYLMLGYGAWAERARFSLAGFGRMLARETRTYLQRR